MGNRCRPTRTNTDGNSPHRPVATKGGHDAGSPVEQWPLNGARGEKNWPLDISSVLDGSLGDDADTGIDTTVSDDDDDDDIASSDEETATADIDDLQAPHSRFVREAHSADGTLVSNLDDRFEDHHVGRFTVACSLGLGHSVRATG